ncbi:hypothetical protein QVD17_20934 [Tagetes erecta]|uniref:Uncharacterized protein n=1 Tax=Tagetes erecta TaxID=13708 RepID=A0AAD8NRF9_TARER|nr:hypothetical protein QVD17_20934 [Tagetes erecta]
MLKVIRCKGVGVAGSHSRVARVDEMSAIDEDDGRFEDDICENDGVEVAVVYSARMEFEKERVAQVKLKNRLEQLEKDQEEERKQSRIELEKERAKREKLQKRMNDVIIG